MYDQTLDIYLARAEGLHWLPFTFVLDYLKSRMRIRILDSEVPGETAPISSVELRIDIWSSFNPMNHLLNSLAVGPLWVQLNSSFKYLESENNALPEYYKHDQGTNLRPSSHFIPFQKKHSEGHFQHILKILKFWGLGYFCCIFWMWSGLHFLQFEIA